jgi:hypothetical protein
MGKASWKRRYLIWNWQDAQVYEQLEMEVKGIFVGHGRGNAWMPADSGHWVVYADHRGTEGLAQVFGLSFLGSGKKLVTTHRL